MPSFTPKERRAHYNEVGYGNAPVKADSKYSEEEQRSYARGQADARNEQAMAAVLGKNSTLSEAEKNRIKAENKEMRECAKAGNMARVDQIKQNRRRRVAARNKRQAK